MRAPPYLENEVAHRQLPQHGQSKGLCHKVGWKQTSEYLVYEEL